MELGLPCRGVARNQLTEGAASGDELGSAIGLACPGLADPERVAPEPAATGLADPEQAAPSSAKPTMLNAAKPIPTRIPPQYAVSPPQASM